MFSLFTIELIYLATLERLILSVKCPLYAGNSRSRYYRTCSEMKFVIVS